MCYLIYLQIELLLECISRTKLELLLERISTTKGEKQLYLGLREAPGHSLLVTLGYSRLPLVTPSYPWLLLVIACYSWLTLVTPGSWADPISEATEWSCCPRRESVCEGESSARSCPTRSVLFQITRPAPAITFHQHIHTCSDISGMGKRAPVPVHQMDPGEFCEILIKIVLVCLPAARPCPLSILHQMRVADWRAGLSVTAGGGRGLRTCEQLGVIDVEN